MSEMGEFLKDRVLITFLQSRENQKKNEKGREIEMKKIVRRKGKGRECRREAELAYWI